MTRSAAAPSFLLGAAGAVCAVSVVGALRAWDTSWTIVAVAVLAFLAGRTPARAVGALAIGLLFAGIVAGELIHLDSDDVVPEIMLPATLYVAGLALRGRETVAGRLADQARELTAERDAYARLSVRNERARIASELHDVVAHAISVMVVQASAGRRLAAREPSSTTRTFAVIAGAARQAQADLDRLADLLAQDDVPQQGTDLELVRDVVETAAASGVPVTLTARGDLAQVRGTAAHAGLRIVQEGLTNALRYAPGAAVTVTIDVRPGALEVEVTNAAPVAPVALGLGSGHGLGGLRERVGACGGTVSAGSQDGGGWQLGARIPLVAGHPHG